MQINKELETYICKTDERYDYCPYCDNVTYKTGSRHECISIKYCGSCRDILKIMPLTEKQELIILDKILARLKRDSAAGNIITTEGVIVLLGNLKNYFFGEENGKDLER